MSKLLQIELSLLIGLAVCAATWIMFYRLKARNGVVHPFVRNNFNCNLVLFAFVSGTALGLTLVVSGIVSAITSL